MPHPGHAAYWLLPAEPARAWCAAQIHRLAAECAAAVFEPHVTIYATESSPGEDPAALLREAARGLGGLALRVRGIGHSGVFTKTLFVEFEPSDGLRAFSDRLRVASAIPRDFELKPHLSLLYAAIDCESRERLAAALDLPFPEIRFDAVRPVRFQPPVETRADVERWRPLDRIALGG